MKTDKAVDLRELHLAAARGSKDHVGLLSWGNTDPLGVLPPGNHLACEEETGDETLCQAAMTAYGEHEAATDLVSELVDRRTVEEEPGA